MKQPSLLVEVRVENEAIASVYLALATKWTVRIQGAGISLSTAIQTWLFLYAAKTPYLPTFPFQRAPLSSFQNKVLSAMGKIPFGTTWSYKRLAQEAGSHHAFRAVGGACKTNPFPLFFPCHRVISSNGSMGGFALDLQIKKELLLFESEEGLCPS